MCEPKQQAWAFSENQRGEIVLTDQAHQLTSGGGKPGQGYPAVLLSEASSAGSEEWTTDSTEPDSNTCSSASPTSGGEECSPTTGPECPSTRTYETLLGTVTHALSSEGADASEDGTGRGTPLVFSAAASPAKTSPSPANAEDSQATEVASSSSSPESSTLFDPDLFSSRTYPVSSLARAVGTSEQSLERWPSSGTAWLGGLSTAVSSECRSDDAGCSSSEPSLTEILEPPQSVAARYSLSARAAQGILRRAEKRGRTLPEHLAAALEAVAGHRTPNA